MYNWIQNLKKKKNFTSSDPHPGILFWHILQFSLAFSLWHPIWHVVGSKQIPQASGAGRGDEDNNEAAEEVEKKQEEGVAPLLESRDPHLASGQ